MDEDVQPVKEKEKPQNSNLKSLNADQKNAIFDDFAFALADVLNNSEVRELIKEEALLEFDGDYDILYSSIKDHVFSTSETFEDLIINASGGNLTASELDQFVRLNISVPVEIESWDAVNFTPSVVIVPVGVQESSYTSYDGYDNNQQAITVSAEEDPNIPYVVVSQNERCNENGEVNEDILLASQRGDALGASAVVTKHHTGGSPSDPCAHRQDGNFENMGLFKTPDLAAIEKWGKGCPEIKFWAMAPLNSGLRVDWLEEYKRVKYKQTGWLKTENKVIVQNWFVASSVGDNITYRFIESDDLILDSSVSSTIPNSNGGSVTVNHDINSKDDDLGQLSIYHTDCWNTDNKLQYIWWINYDRLL